MSVGVKKKKQKTCIKILMDLIMQMFYLKERRKVRSLQYGRKISLPTLMISLCSCHILQPWEGNYKRQCDFTSLSPVWFPPCVNNSRENNWNDMESLLPVERTFSSLDGTNRGLCFPPSLEETADVQLCLKSSLSWALSASFLGHYVLLLWG